MALDFATLNPAVSAALYGATVANVPAVENEEVSPELGNLKPAPVAFPASVSTPSAALQESGGFGDRVTIYYFRTAKYAPANVGALAGAVGSSNPATASTITTADGVIVDIVKLSI